MTNYNVLHAFILSRSHAGVAVQLQAAVSATQGK